MGIRPYGLAAVESLRIESGLIFLGYDYFPGVTSPFHMSLDRMIKLDKGDFHGKQALQAEADAGITHRMVTLVVAGEEAPDYGAPVYSNGRGVGKLTSPSAGRSPTVDKVIGMPSLVRAASACMRLCHSARAPASSAVRTTLKWLSSWFLIMC